MQLNAIKRMSDPGKNYRLTEEAVELILTLLNNHKEKLERSGGPDEEFELDLTDDLLAQFEENTA